MNLKLKPLISAVRSRSRPTSHLQPWLTPLFRNATICQRFQSHKSTPKTSEPLRILFCGSDDFSCANLRALHEERVRNPGLIESIDVVVRPGKRVGRGNKKVQHPPLRDLATEFKLTIHERDTFTGWDMPTNINLIIAVSFGLFVPPRLLRGARNGGLNVHPSLLPEFRGAAPLHHALLENRAITGVTLQTLDDKTFDAGVILAQTPLKDAYQIPPDCTAPDLQSALTPLATDMLVQSLREGRHVPPQRAVGWQTEADAASLDESKSPRERRHILPDPSVGAPKITPHMRQLVPAAEALGTWSAHGTVRRQRIIGPLWFMARDSAGKVKRVIVEGELEAIPRKGDELQQPGIYQRFELLRPTTTAARGDGGKNTTGAAQGDPGTPLSTHVLIWVPDEANDVYLTGSVVSASGSEQAIGELVAAHSQGDDHNNNNEPLRQQSEWSDRNYWLRIGQLKVEGEKTKPAKASLAQLASEVVTLEQLRDC